MKCSGYMTRAHDGKDVQLVKLDAAHPNLRALVPMCKPCRDAAGRLGMIDRRDTRRPTDPGYHRPGASPIWLRSTS